MDPKRYLGVRSWVRGGIVTLVATALGVVALTQKQPVIGWVLIGLVVLYFALRVVIVVCLVRMPAGAIPPPTPASNRLLTRVRAITFIVGFSTFGVVALVVALVQPEIIGGGAFVFAGVMFVMAFVFPLLVLRRAQGGETGVTPAPNVTPSDPRREP